MTEKAYSILDKVTLSDISLERVNADAIQNKKSGLQTKGKLKTEWSYNIREHNDKFLVLTANFRLYLVPENLFKFDMEYSIAYECVKELSLEEIKTNAELLLAPCGEMNTLIIAQLIDKMHGSPLIIAPVVKIQD